MQARLSLNEVVSKSTQALQALRFSQGSNIENGKNIGWLEAHGFPGISYLYQEIKCFNNETRKSTPYVENRKTATIIQSPDQSGFSLAQCAIDFAEVDKRVIIENCKYPLLMLSEATRRSNFNFGFKLNWIEKGRPRVGYSIFGNSYTETRYSSTWVNKGLRIELITDLKASLPRIAQSHKVNPIKNGINFKRKEWELICNTAKKLLVPTSKVSRSSAGPEVDDNFL